jgi:hypothetical protein
MIWLITNGWSKYPTRIGQCKRHGHNQQSGSCALRRDLRSRISVMCALRNLKACNVISRSFTQTIAVGLAYAEYGKTSVYNSRNNIQIDFQKVSVGRSSLARGVLRTFIYIWRSIRSWTFQAPVDAVHFARCGKTFLRWSRCITAGFRMLSRNSLDRSPEKNWWLTNTSYIYFRRLKIVKYQKYISTVWYDKYRAYKTLGRAPNTIHNISIWHFQLIDRRYLA